MSRSGYVDDYANYWQVTQWRAAVASALRGKRGQAFLREMLAAMDALPEKKLIDADLEADGMYCAIGTVGGKRGMDMSSIDPDDSDDIAGHFGIAHAMACEIMYQNDEAGPWSGETPEQRFSRVREWIVSNLRDQP